MGRTVKAFTGVAISTSARTFPAHIGRRKVTAAPSPPKARTSVAIPASRRAATRGRRSLPYAVAAAPTKPAPCVRASAATTGACASARGWARTGASATCTCAPCRASSAPSAFTPLPRSATWSFPPVRAARARPAASAWSVALRRAPPCCSATMRTSVMVSFSLGLA